MKNLTVSEAKNYITGFHKIGVLSFISALGVWTAVPVYAVALHDDRVVGQLEIDHELVEHDDLLTEGDAVLAQSISHCALDVGALTRGETLEVSKNRVLLTAIFFTLSAGWDCFKFLATVGAGYQDFFFPVGIVGTYSTKLAGCMKTFLRAVGRVLSDTLTDIELLAAMLASAGYFGCFFVDLLLAIVGKKAIARAVFSIPGTSGGNKKCAAADDALDRYTRRPTALVGAENVNAFFAAGFRHINRLAASGAGVEGHKRNLLSDGWHVCLGHAGPTGGIHNYIRLWANHQAQACPKPLHYTTCARGLLA